MDRTFETSSSETLYINTSHSLTMKYFCLAVQSVPVTPAAKYPPNIRVVTLYRYLNLEMKLLLETFGEDKGSFYIFRTPLLKYIV